MSWPCYLVEHFPGVSLWHEVGDKSKHLQWKDLKPGAMWFEDDGDPNDLVVKLPSGSEWHIDRGRHMNAQPDRVGKPRIPQWMRTGEPPNITANPSINHVGRYHGWLKDGVLTDDCEGRVFE